MSVVNGKRITFKRTRPNPLFHDWLEELYEEAKQKGSKLESMLQEALSSISKYPLPLQSGAECAILKGFDKRLCLFIDKRLDVYKSSSNESSVDTCSKSTASSGSDDDSDVIPVIESQSTSKGTKSPCTTSTPTECTKVLPSTSSSSSSAKNGKKRYKPAFRSGSYAFLIVLMELKKNQTMSKGQLIAASQKHCDKDISIEWKNITGLIRRGLVNKSVKNNIPRFCLTAEGIYVAKELFSHAQNKKGVDNTITNDDLANNDNVFDNNENQCSEVIIIDSEAKSVFTNGLINDSYRSESEVNDLLYDESKCKNEINNIMPINSTKTLMHNNCSSKVVHVDSHVDYSNCIEMVPGSFDVILLIDKHETSGMTKKNDPTVTQFNKYPELKHEYRSLKVGDFTWIARHKTNTDHEIVLPYVVERKRMDDLGHSIKDGRFHEQKFRLRKCGLNHVIYMVENHGSNKHVGLPMQSLMQALANTRVQDGFKVHVTESLAHSVRFLATMTLRLMYEYKDKRLMGHNGEPKSDILMTFGYFNKSSVKNRALSITDTFIKILLQLKGVSVQKALTITNVYKTPRMLIEKYKSCDQREGEMLLANLKFGELNRSVGPSVSKSVYQLFTFRNMK
ncbi:crossover junction endonuclease MUS81 [Maniola jurtina]|uniref:crossover junction endonuclease MUS81 n=1 Tax=Maniola jurtina TaxID=191418 RepID=UPI001E68A363|nr:crossover junction endonuclease MUS81 [Maniola jurtina]